MLGGAFEVANRHIGIVLLKICVENKSVLLISDNHLYQRGEIVVESYNGQVILVSSLFSVIQRLTFVMAGLSDK